MATKGYRQYRGRGRGGRILPVVLLLLILLAAILFLIAQKFIVYHDDGSVRLDLPFFGQQADQAGPSDIPAEDVDIQYEDPDPEEQTPEKPSLQVLQARELPYSCLNSDPTASLGGQSAVVVNVKRADGTLAYHTGVALPDGVLRGSEATLTHLQAITGSDCYTVARLSTLCDSSFADVRPDAAITYTGGSLWWDNYNRNWLDPSNEAAQQYLCDLAAECVQLGFDEILLDQFRFPIEGDLSQTNAAAVADRAAVLTDLIQKIRAAVGPSVAVSIILPASIGTDYSFTASGLSAQLFMEEFDRIYVPQDSSAYYWLNGALTADFDRSTRLVLTTAAPLSAGSYMIAY